MLLEALIPIVAIIGLGFVIARMPFAADTGWELLERLTYYLFFPSLLVLELSSTRVQVAELVPIALVLGLALAILSVLFVGLRQFIARDSASLSSVYQGSIRFNTYIGLAVVEAILGDNGLRLAALCLLVYIPAVNILSVIAITAGSQDTGKRGLLAVGSVLSNPLVLACAAGLALSQNMFSLPDILWQMIEILSPVALPLGLLSVGAGIRFVALGEQSWQLAVAMLNKLLVFPSLVLLACVIFSLESDYARVLLILTALPAPPSAYILARQLGGNVALMANIISLQTIAAFILIPIWIDLGQRLSLLNIFI
ncbi:MAG: AEC family transporter [Pseudomonadales bacterium]|nr:AEC family transporter [Pseudomonadales bacterium]